MNDNRSNTSPELTTPNVIDQEDVSKSPLSENLEQIDLNITNLEGTPEMKRKESSINSSPTTNYEFDDSDRGHRHTVSTSDIPRNAIDPETRINRVGRQYSLDLSTGPGHVVIEIEQEQKRRTYYRAFKIILVVIVLGVTFIISALLLSWEFGYFGKKGTFTAPIFY